MENENENLDSSNETNDGTQTIDASLDAEAKLVALQEQNKKLFARAKKAEGFTLNSSGEWVKKEIVKPKEESTPINQSPKPLDILRDDAFKLYRDGYNEDEIDLIIRNGGRKILEDKNNPIYLGLKVAREQRQAENAVSKTSDSSSLSEIERKYTPEQLNNMSVKDLEKILPRA